MPYNDLQCLISKLFADIKSSLKSNNTIYFGTIFRNHVEHFKDLLKFKTLNLNNIIGVIDSWLK